MFNKRNNNFEKAITDFSTRIGNAKHLYQKYTYVSFPEYKVVTNVGMTAGITSCCVIILYNDNNTNSPYVFGHFNSIEFSRGNGVMSNLFKDELPKAIAEAELATDKLKAMVVGGDANFFHEICAYLKKNNIEITASYLDEYATNRANADYCNKAVIFEPKFKKLIIYTPILPRGTLVLQEGKHILLRDYQQQLISAISHYNDLLVSYEIKPELEPQNQQQQLQGPPKRRFSMFEETELKKQETEEKDPRVVELEESLKKMDIITTSKTAKKIAKKN